MYKHKAAGNALYDETFTIAADLTKDYYQRGLNFNDCNNFAWNYNTNVCIIVLSFVIREEGKVIQINP